MACNCRICVQGREMQRHLSILEEQGLTESAEFFESIYTELMNVGLDNNVNQSIIEGSWPTADENIRGARQRFQEVMRKWKSEDKKHVCGLMGFNPMLGDTCPKCEEERG